MQKVFSVKNLFVLLAIFVLAILLVLPNNIINSSSNAQEKASSGALGNSVKVELVNREDEVTPFPSQIEYSGGTAFVSQWSQSKEFRINYVVDEDNIPTGIPDTSDPEILNYTMTINVEYLQGYSDSEGGFNIDAKVLFEDVVIDGEFEIEGRDTNLKWRGSPNQNVIDVQKSLEQNKLVLYCD